MRCDGVGYDDLQCFRWLVMELACVFYDVMELACTCDAMIYNDLQ